MSSSPDVTHGRECFQIWKVNANILKYAVADSQYGVAIQHEH
jgi:hypothetical protein